MGEKYKVIVWRLGKDGYATQQVEIVDDKQKALVRKSELKFKDDVISVTMEKVR